MPLEMELIKRVREARRKNYDSLAPFPRVGGEDETVAREIWELLPVRTPGELLAMAQQIRDLELRSSVEEYIRFYHSTCCHPLSSFFS
jgi:hypothetical protein